MSEPNNAEISSSEQQLLLKEEALECAAPRTKHRLLNTKIGWILSVIFGLTTLLLAVRLFVLPDDRYQHTGEIVVKYH